MPPKPKVTQLSADDARANKDAKTAKNVLKAAKAEEEKRKAAVDAQRAQRIQVRVPRAVSVGWR